MQLVAHRFHIEGKVKHENDEFLQKRRIKW